jgi:uncharacterized membrane protein YesL
MPLPEDPARPGALERAFRDCYSALLTLAAINALWFLMSLTVVLMAPATAALYRVAADADRGRGPYLRAYTSAVRQLLLPGWLWGIATALLAVIGITAISFYSVQPPPYSAVLTIISLAILIVAAGAQFYFWPYMVLQDRPSIRRALRNALFTVLADPRLFLPAGVGLVLLAASCILIVPMVTLTPSLLAFLGTYTLRDWLEKHQLFSAEP